MRKIDSQCGEPTAEAERPVRRPLCLRGQELLVAMKKSQVNELTHPRPVGKGTVTQMKWTQKARTVADRVPPRLI